MKIGISGHQKFENQVVENWVRRTIANILKDLSPKVGVTSLAEGADQIFAEEILKINAALHVVVPCKSFEENFSNRRALKSYKELSGLATETEILDFIYPSAEAFLGAGKQVVDSSDCMIFVWNKLPSAGTEMISDIFAYSIMPQKKMFLLNVSLMEVEFFRF